MEQSTGRFIEPLQWSAKVGKMKGKHPEATLFNNYLDTLKNQVYEQHPMILEVFKQHNQEISQLIGKDFAAGTLSSKKPAFNGKT